MNGISAAILAGGLGTRLRAVVSDRPKVLAPVAGRPFLARLLDQLADAGVREVTLLTGFAAKKIRDEFGDRYRDLRLNHSREPEPLGTGGALRLALPFLTQPTILLLNGDSYCDVNLPALVEHHRQTAALATLALADVLDGSRYGRVIQAADGRIERFEEKGGSAEPGRINAGIYLFQREVVEEIPAGRTVSLEREVLPEQVNRGLAFGFPGGRFIDIGTPESFAASEEFFRKP
jgi:D-glycero-alpha-D-manno-heptose 1-phosphate guanylyltransferase